MSDFRLVLGNADGDDDDDHVCAADDDDDDDDDAPINCQHQACY